MGKAGENDFQASTSSYSLLEGKPQNWMQRPGLRNQTLIMPITQNILFA